METTSRTAPTPVLLVASALLFAACQQPATAPLLPEETPAFAVQAAPSLSSDIVAVPFFLADDSCEPFRLDGTMPAPGTLLFDARGCEPVTAPDGRHLTWSDFSTPTGRIGVKCIEQGTHVVLHLRGLIPHGVYTAWNVAFHDPGFTAEFDATLNPLNLSGVGPLGSMDGSRSAFTASASGHASISAITKAGRLGTFGEIGGCALTDEFEWHVVTLYHFDGRTHGSDLGPAGTMAEQSAFIFRSDS
jgi:hypothetical protein